jgi:cytidylate kinase
MKRRIVTIDGPAGAGKTTVSRLLAKRLGYRYIDTGALYRGVALAVKLSGIRSNDDAGLRGLCSTLKLTFLQTEKGLRLMSNGMDITERIRTPEITMLASAVSARQSVRCFLLDIQQNLGREKNIVIEGRDMGTVVFPDADVKFFLDAAPEIRAQRRFAEFREQSSQTLQAVKNDLSKRDRNDRSREFAPLRPADDAIIVDSTHLSAEEVVDCMLRHIASPR